MVCQLIVKASLGGSIMACSAAFTILCSQLGEPATVIIGHEGSLLKRRTGKDQVMVTAGMDMVKGAVQANDQVAFARVQIITDEFSAHRQMTGMRFGGMNQRLKPGVVMDVKEEASVGGYTILAGGNASCRETEKEAVHQCIQMHCVSLAVREINHLVTRDIQNTAVIEDSFAGIVVPRHPAGVGVVGGSQGEIFAREKIEPVQLHLTVACPVVNKIARITAKRRDKIIKRVIRRVA